jgi:hypothetical protein
VATLHIVIPVYNERGTLSEIVARVLAAPLAEGFGRWITLIDDCSSPAHFPAVKALVDRLQEAGTPLRFLRHEVNKGKGAALQTGFDAILASTAADDDLVIIQDADLEYDPADYASLMQPIVAGQADAAVGTRWGDHHRYRSLKHRVHALGNGALTLLSNMMTGFRVSDMECCYKIMPVRVLRQLRPMLTEQRFGIEPQIIAGLARLRMRVVQRPVKYDPRGLAAGKKIGWRDGVRALVVIGRERFRR